VKATTWSQYLTLVRQGLRAEFVDKERLISPVLFSLTMLVLFAFALGDLDQSLRIRVYLAETFLTALFALQMSFSRLFEPDRQDRVFELLRTYPISYTSLFLAKYSLVLILGSATLIPTMLFGAFLHQSANQQLFSWVVLGIGLLALAGLGALGVLLSALTLKAQARQIIYPLLYFPMTTPVLLAAVQSARLCLDVGLGSPELKSWLGLLAAFDIIYITLGVLLFTELMDES